MPDTAAITGNAPAPTPDKDAPADDKFAIEELPTYAVAIGHPAHIVAGAFAGAGQTRKVTIAQAKKRCDEWLKGEAEIDPAHLDTEE